MFLRWLRLIVTSTFFLYALCFLVVWKLLDFQKAKVNAITETMSRYVPPILYFKDFVYKNKDYDEFKLRWCIDYHRKAAQLFSYQKSEALAMTAFCYDRFGDQTKAIDFYQASAQANPVYFWPYYNLGVLSFKKGEYAKAISFFQEALNKDIKKNMFLLLQSKVYLDVRLSDNPNYDLLQSYNEGSFNSYIYILESLFHLKKYQQMFEVSNFVLKKNFGKDDIFYYYAGIAAFHQKAFEQAFELFQLSLEKDPQNPETVYYLGLSFQMMGKNDLAKVFLARAVEIRQKNGSQIEQYLNQGIRFF
jgi:tetratricopeptide (TPR) repeat protein